jgi:hypothetical protein
MGGILVTLEIWLVPVWPRHRSIVKSGRVTSRRESVGKGERAERENKLETGGDNKGPRNTRDEADSGGTGLTWTEVALVGSPTRMAPRGESKGSGRVSGDKEAWGKGRTTTRGVKMEMGICVSVCVLLCYNYYKICMLSVYLHPPLSLSLSLFLSLSLSFSLALSLYFWV